MTWGLAVDSYPELSLRFLLGEADCSRSSNMVYLIHWGAILYQDGKQGKMEDDQKVVTFDIRNTQLQNDWESDFRCGSKELHGLKAALLHNITEKESV